MSIGKMFLSAIMAEGSVAALLQYGPVDHLFKASEVDVYAFVKGFVKAHQKIPGPETIEAHTGDALVPHKEPASYYFELMQFRHVELELKKGMKRVSDLMLPENKDVGEALKIMTEAVMELVGQKHAKQIVDFRDAYEIIMADYAAKWNKDSDHGLMFGWPTLDTMSGGMVKGDLISIVGRPQKGKSWQMLYAAHYGWAKTAMTEGPENAQSRLFVSMEMSPLAIEQRLAAMHAHVPASKLKHATLATPSLKKLKKGLTEIKGYGSPFYIVDGNLAATVEDIYMLARQLKPDAIFVDGAYLTKHPTERDRYRRVAENAELMKSELASLAPTVASWQFAKTASKKKKGEKVTGDDIGYSDAIFQVSSLVLGLFEEDSVETLKQRMVEILKGRSGEVGHFFTHWNFEQMIFSEIEQTAIEDMQFM